MDEQRGTDQGIRILSYLVAGLIFYGGLGWLGDRWLGTSFLMPAGLILGVVLGMYLIIKRFGGST